MRVIVRLTLLGVLCTAVGISAGQEKSAKIEPARPDVNSIEVRFADDSLVKMTLQNPTIVVSTRYGKLVVPVEEMRRIELGLRIPEATLKRIEAAVKSLGDANFQKREAAGTELLALRELAYPAVQKAARSKDPEVARRAEQITKTLTEKLSADKLHIPQHDTVVTAEFTIVGQVESAQLKARTPYFGETSLNLGEIRTVRWLATGRDSKIVVEAARHGGQQEVWLDTNIEVRSGSTLQISATGSVDLMPNQPGNMVVNPDGTNQRLVGANGAVVPAAPRAARGARAGPQQMHGALVGRIGERGRIFVVGSKFDAPANEDGKLYLRIIPSPYGTESTGAYDVHINSDR
jgi:hypothetical protein